MSIKIYRYPADLSEVIEDQQDLHAIGDYANYEEDEYMNLPTVPDDVAKVLDRMYGRKGGTLPLVVQYIDSKTDLGQAYVGVGDYWNGEFSESIDGYYIATPEYGLSIVVVPEEFADDLDFVLSLQELDIDDENEWLPKTLKQFKARLKECGLDIKDYESVLFKHYNVKLPVEKLIKNYKGGDLDLRDTDVTSLPEDLKVDGNLNLEGTNITSLPKGLEVGGDLSLRKTDITSLPGDLKVNGSLYLTGTKVTFLPEGLKKVKGELNLRDTDITSLPEDLEVDGDLNLEGTKITFLPEDLKVGGDLDLGGTGIISLPEDFKVNGNLDLDNTDITFLPEGLEVDGYLNLKNTKITFLPEDLKVKGSDIWLPDGTEVDTAEEAREYLEKQNKQKNSSKTSRDFLQEIITASKNYRI